MFIVFGITIAALLFVFIGPLSCKIIEKFSQRVATKVEDAIVVLIVGSLLVGFCLQGLAVIKGERVSQYQPIEVTEKATLKYNKQALYYVDVETEQGGTIEVPADLYAKVKVGDVVYIETTTVFLGPVPAYDKTKVVTIPEHIEVPK